MNRRYGEPGGPVGKGEGTSPLRKLFFVAVSLAAASLCSPAQSSPASSMEQEQAFQLGFALQEPAAQTEMFLEAVKALRDVPDEAQASEVSKLAIRAASLRQKEARAYTLAAAGLRRMGAPPDLQTWAQGTAAGLNAPLRLSDEAKRSLPGDPNTADVLGTIDEADKIKLQSDRQMSRVTVWLKLSAGTKAVWASTVGAFAAELDASVGNDRALSLSQSEPIRLYDTAPPGTPPSVLDALFALAPKRGNLAGLIPLSDVMTPPLALSGTRDALLTAYDAEPLAATIDKGP